MRPAIEPIVDTHCHVLPGLDDGPPTLGVAIALAGQLRQAGVVRALCTPHYSRQYPTPHNEAAARLGELRAALAEARIELTLDLAAEVSPGLCVSAPDEELFARTIARRFLLVEVQPDTTEIFLETAVQRVFELGLVPVLAHPERGRSLSRHLDELESIRNAGAVVQIVAPSLLGDAGRAAAATAWGLLERGSADLLASDSHGWWRSPAYLHEAAGAVAERFGPDLRRVLTQTNPGMLLDGLHPREPKPGR